LTKVLQTELDSKEQRKQPSLGRLFPSSQSSLKAFFPSPHEEVQMSGSFPEQTNPKSFTQLEQPSSGTELPSSHSSLGDLLEFPQEEVQVEGVPEQLNPYSI